MKSAADIIPSLFVSPETVSGNNSDVVVTGFVVVASVVVTGFVVVTTVVVTGFVVVVASVVVTGVAVVVTGSVTLGSLNISKLILNYSSWPEKKLLDHIIMYFKKFFRFHLKSEARV